MDLRKLDSPVQFGTINRELAIGLLAARKPRALTLRLLWALLVSNLTAGQRLRHWVLKCTGAPTCLSPVKAEVVACCPEIEVISVLA